MNIAKGPRIDSPGNEYNLSANLSETLSLHARGERRGLFVFADRERVCVFKGEKEREMKLLALFYP